MKFPVKLFVVFTVAFAFAVGMFSGAALRGVRHAFAALERERVASATELLERDIEHRGADVDHRIAAVAESEATLAMALDLGRPQPDYSLYRNDARGVATHQDLELFEFVTDDGTIISSFHAPERLGQKNDWIRAAAEREKPGAFLARLDLPDGPVIALLAARAVSVGAKKLYIAGGRRLDQGLIKALPLPAGLRALLFLNLDEQAAAQSLIDSDGTLVAAGPLSPLLEGVRRKAANATGAAPFPDAAAPETFYAVPFRGPDQSVLAVVVFGHTAAERLAVEGQLKQEAFFAGVAGILLGLCVGFWGAASVSRPLERLVTTARAMAAGSEHARALAKGGAEVAAIARALNETSERLAAGRDRQLQAERVAAWREMARRMAHDLEPAIARLELSDGAGRGAWLEAIERLRRLHDRFSEFGELFVLPLQTARLNEIVRAVVRDFEPLFSSALGDLSRPPITPEIYLAEALPAVQADPGLLTRAIDHLLLFAVYSMPAGGTITLRTEALAAGVRLEIAWNGAAPTREEGERLFTPGGLSREYATGFELATVQAIVSDHGGTITVASGGGYTRIWLELPFTAARSAPPAPPAREPQPTV